MPNRKTKTQKGPTWPEPPGHLDDIARREYVRVVAELEGRFGVCALDQALLAAYCTTWSAYVEADEQVQKYGSVLVSKKTQQPYPSPYANLRSTAIGQLRQLAIELGLSAIMRHRLAQRGKPAEPTEPGAEPAAEISDPLGEIRLHKAS